MMARRRVRRLDLRGLWLSLRADPDEHPRTVAIDDTVEKLAWLAKLGAAGLLTRREFELAQARVLHRSHP